MSPVHLFHQFSPKKQTDQHRAINCVVERSNQQSDYGKNQHSTPDESFLWEHLRINCP